MREKKYTQTEWKIADSEPKTFVYALNEHGHNRFFFNISASGKSSASAEEVEANANLIAAAPELLEACELMLDKMDEVSDPYVLDAYEQIESAVKKAYGETP